MGRFPVALSGFRPMAANPKCWASACVFPMAWVGCRTAASPTATTRAPTFPPARSSSAASRAVFSAPASGISVRADYDPERIVPPIVYMPQELDSSCGGQLWVEKDERFGPLSGQFFHTSFGRARTMYVMLDDLGEVVQGAVFSLPLPMESGTMRIARNPIDGQLYFSGLTGWQAGATREGSVQRLRFTGEGGLYLLDAKARNGRIELSFNQPLASPDTASWQAKMWNYRWSKQYGSPYFKVTEPDVEGSDVLKLGDAKLAADGRKLILRTPDLQPCHTLKLDFCGESKTGAQFGGAGVFHDSPTTGMSPGCNLFSTKWSCSHRKVRFSRSPKNQPIFCHVLLTPQIPSAKAPAPVRCFRFRTLLRSPPQLLTPNPLPGASSSCTIR